MARWDPDRGRLSVWTATQAPYMVRKELSGVLGLDVDQIEMHEVAVGGGFGARSKICEFEAIACKLSIKSARPVRLVLTRDEEFATTKCRHNVVVDLTTSATASGDLQSRRAAITVDNGAYNHSGPSVMGYATLVLGSLYRTEGVQVDGRLVYTNKHPGGQFRGYGAPQATFAIESQMDELADALGLDPIDLRIRNANRPGDVTHTGWKLESARLVECLDAARDAIGWDEKRPWKGSGRGVGVAAAIHVSGAYIYDAANQGSAAIDVHEDGRLVVRHGGSDAGTWQKTVLAQFAAEELGTDVGRFSVVMMDSNQTPVDLGAWSSRGTYVGGHAVVAAGRKMRELLRELAAATLGERVDAITIGDGVATGATSSITFADLAARHGRDGVLSVTEEVTLDVEPLDRATGVSNISGAYSFAVQAVEVDVDADTGRVRIVDAVSVHDSGVPINPIGLESQIVGGMAMGLGAALGEGLVYEGGRLVNGAYLHYPLPAPPTCHRSVRSSSTATTATDPTERRGSARSCSSRPPPPSPTPSPTPRASASASCRSHLIESSPPRLRGRRVAGARITCGAGRIVGGSRRCARCTRGGCTPFCTTRERDSPGRSRHDRSARSSDRPRWTKRSSNWPPGDGDRWWNRSPPRPPARLGACRHRRRRRPPPGTGHLSHDQHGWRIGGAIRLHRLEQGDGTPAQRLVAETVRTIASPQIRAMATVAGNLCQEKRCWFYRNDFACFKRGGWTCPCYAVNGDHRYHHAVAGAHRCQAVTPSDLATTLVALDAEAIVHGRHGRRRSVPMADFFTGPGETTLGDDELLVEIVVGDQPAWTHVAFEKLRLWEGDFAIVSAAVALRLVDDTVQAASGVCRRDRPDSSAAGPPGGRPRRNAGRPRRGSPSARRDVVEHRPSARQQRMEARRGDGRGDDGDRPRPGRPS